MSAPAKQTKIKYQKGKTEVVYESNLDATEYYLFELSRAALKDVGKYVCTRFREAYDAVFKTHSKRGGRGVSFSVISSKKTTAPRVQIGWKTKKPNGFYSSFQELGTSQEPKRGLLTKVCSDKKTISEIVTIESKYLSGLEGEAARLNALIKEGDYEGDLNGTK